MTIITSHHIIIIISTKTIITSHHITSPSSPPLRPSSHHITIITSTVTITIITSTKTIITSHHHHLTTTEYGRVHQHMGGLMHRVWNLHRQHT